MGEQGQHTAQRAVCADELIQLSSSWTVGRCLSRVRNEQEIGEKCAGNRNNRMEKRCITFVTSSKRSMLRRAAMSAVRLMTWEQRQLEWKACRQGNT